MKLKNRPSKYVKRSDLPGRSLHVRKSESSVSRKPKYRDFSKVEIDSSFYFTWGHHTDPKGR
jgi:hypothetical protein